jgi:hypothetical protein
MDLYSNRVERQDASGSGYSRVQFDGHYPQLQPAGAEGRSNRLLVKPLYHAPVNGRLWVDSRTDDMSARATYTPRFLT